MMTTRPSADEDVAMNELQRIGVDGDMPQHGHGLPTRPQVTDYLGDDVPGWKA